MKSFLLLAPWDKKNLIWGHFQPSLEKENAHKLFGIIFLWKCNKTQLTTFK
jgi:hypothetical protein